VPGSPPTVTALTVTARRWPRPAPARCASARRARLRPFARGHETRKHSRGVVLRRLATGVAMRERHEERQMEASRMKIVYVISDRNSRKYWNRIGVAFINGDGSINVKLEAIPVSGEMQIRDYVPREDALRSLPARSGAAGSLAPVARGAVEREAGDAGPRCA
jgi:hypothetical protein